MQAFKNNKQLKIQYLRSYSFQWTVETTQKQPLLQLPFAMLTLLRAIPEEGRQVMEG